MELFPSRVVESGFGVKTRAAPNAHRGRNPKKVQTLPGEKVCSYVSLGDQHLAYLVRDELALPAIITSLALLHD